LLSFIEKTQATEPCWNGFLDGLALYEDRPDKGYSLADCISMQIMRLEGLTHVLSNDRHFEQEGFTALFR
jgi:predicted nucleic acid-binding protein